MDLEANAKMLWSPSCIAPLLSGELVLRAFNPRRVLKHPRLQLRPITVTQCIPSGFSVLFCSLVRCCLALPLWEV